MRSSCQGRAFYRIKVNFIGFFNLKTCKVFSEAFQSLREMKCLEMLLLQAEESDASISEISCGSARPLSSSSTKSGLDKTRGTSTRIGLVTNTDPVRSTHRGIDNMFFDYSAAFIPRLLEDTIVYTAKMFGAPVFPQLTAESTNKPAGKHNMLACCLDTIHRRPEPTL